jgi:hypothetical protein
MRLLFPVRTFECLVAKDFTISSKDIPELDFWLVRVAGLLWPKA